jgi:hypothetical protein
MKDEGETFEKMLKKSVEGRPDAKEDEHTFKKSRLACILRTAACRRCSTRVFDLGL